MVRQSIKLFLVAIISMSLARAIAHVEAVEIAFDLIADRDHATAELRIPITELIMSEQPIDAVEPPNFKQDSMVVANRHADELLKAVRINYDSTVMKWKIVKTSVRSLVLGVGGEDITPRDCAVYNIEYMAEGPIVPPTNVVVRHTLFKLPDEAGFQPTVLCLINFRQADQTKVRSDVIGHDERLTLKTQWTTPAKPVMAQAGSNPQIAPLEHEAPPAPPNSLTSRRPARGPLIMLLVAAGIIVGLAVVLAKQKRL